MKRFIGVLLTLTLVAACGGNRFTQVVDKTIGSTVKIQVSGVQGGALASWLGTGVIIDSAGHILTCEHVVPTRSVLIYVTLYRSRTVHLARVLRRDRKRDLALIQFVNYPLSTHAVELSRGPVSVGDEVVAIGMPYGLDWSVTTGVVSALHRTGLAVNLTQTDAAINPGNSGGPLFDMEGRIVGINESGYQGANNLGFAVSVEEIRGFLSVFKGLEETF